MAIEIGIQRSKIDILKTEADDVIIDDKICVILFNEVPLRPATSDDGNKVDGYENFGNGKRSENIADHALIFMIQGVCRKMNHIVAYYFVKRPMESEQLAEIITEVIRAVTEAGYEVIATVCDHALTNIQALDLLANCKNSMDSNYFILDERKIYIMYDVPHLYLSIRNDFREDGELILDNKNAKWAHLIQLEAENLELQEVTKIHLNPTGQAIKDVNLAIDLLSRNVAGYLHYNAKAYSSDEIKMEIADTVKVIVDLDQLLNCTNRPLNRDDVIKGMRQSVKKNTFHHERWPEFIAKLKTMQYPNLEGDAKLRSQRCINGFITNLLSLQGIWKYLLGNQIYSLILRHLNMDELQKTFKLIKKKCSNKQNPTCEEFSLGFIEVEKSKSKKSKIPCGMFVF